MCVCGGGDDACGGRDDACVGGGMRDDDVCVWGGGDACARGCACV